MKSAVIAIGRNEGARLVACLQAVQGKAARIIYVDSGSTDDSLTQAIRLGAEIVNLDTSKPFTAARARNAGFETLKDDPNLRYVHFIDGDCEMQPDWLAQAEAFLDNHPETAVVFGRRRERFPDATFWNKLTDAEWARGEKGQVKACGGDALMRISAFKQVQGFNPALIAGEEPELCVRLRAQNWQIWRLDAEMTLHDADMTRFGQWWQRARRAGYTYAEGVAMHGRPPERHNVARLKRTLTWGLMLPALVLLAGLLTPWAFALVLIWPIQILRLTWRGMSMIEASVVMLAKFAEVQGVATWAIRALRNKPAQLIEYK